MKHLLIVLMLASAFAFVLGCTQPAEEEVTEETTLCEECGEVCDCTEGVCEECGDKCECETAAEVCEACGKEVCECPAEEVVEEAPAEEGGE